MVAILDPSRSAEPRYLSYNCVLDTGETVYGLLVRESAAGVVIMEIDAKGTGRFRESRSSPWTAPIAR